MEKKPVIIQKIKKGYEDNLAVAIKYFSIISTLNDLKLPKRQIELLAFIACKGSISFGGKKDEFISTFGSSIASIGNMVHKLKKKSLLIKVEGKLKVNPVFQMDFSKIIIQLHIDAKG